MRPVRSTLIGAMLAALAGLPAGAQERLPIFDAHLHYNWEPTPYQPVEKVLEIFRKNGVTGILATSRPNDGTHALVAAKPEDIWVVPFARPYRVRADIQTWFNDPSAFQLIQDEFKRGYYRGVGEFHIYGNSAASEVTGQFVRFAVARDVYLHAHCDEQALELLFAHDRRAKIIWAHTGFSTAPERVSELMEKYPALIGEMSFRGGITDSSGKLTPEWRDLFSRYSDRFVLGSDTWIHARWFQYDNIIAEYRGWLAQLPPEQARRIAYQNAERLFGPRRTN
jgi:hypothetical protein